MLSIMFLITIIMLSFFLKKENVIILILFILPFHFLLKSIFNLIGGGAVSYWKELSFLILFLRIIFYKTIRLNSNSYLRLSTILFLLLLFIVLLYFIISPVKEYAIESFKNYIFPLFVCLLITQLKIDISFIIRFIKLISISAFFVFITAHLQQYFFSFQFAFLMGLAQGVGNNGYIEFINSAFRIMGVARMYGPFVGPNELGLYTSIIVSFLIWILFFQKKIIFSRKWELLLIIILSSGVFTLIESFSRVSWLFTIITISLFVFKIKNNKNNKIILIIIPIFLFTILYLSIIFIPQVNKIFNATVHLQEASAASRPSYFIDGLYKVISVPLGYGLGTIQYQNPNPIFPTEIFWWLVFLEIGLIGGLVMMATWFSFYKTLRSINKKHVYSKNIFTEPSMNYIISSIILGFASIIIFEPIFLITLWSFVGLGINFNYSLL